ncbi:NfeD family protein [Iamia majanohamensis]|uniref:NfeD family protein n=1 Tax=Iamia majanohamensis TaxID=467976 RepID=A0AAE9Y8U2_9ACTN|nr:NfeD family protein [Iamia majanohamensis]WCO66598.1 NfeD family protein [Iamia majanohamensis]
MRRLSTTTRGTGALVVAAAAVVALLLVGGSAPAGAQDDDPAVPTESCVDAGAGGGRISVITVSGLLDPVLARFIGDSIATAEENDAAWLVLQANSNGTVISDDDLAGLVEEVRTSTVPVALWVGPSGTRATEGMAQLASVACRVGVAPGSRLGDLGEPVVEPAQQAPAFQEAAERLRRDTVGADEALELGLAQTEAPVLGAFLISLDGVETEVQEDAEGRPQRAVAGDSIPVFSKLPIVDQLLHTVASPAVAYLLLLAGLALIVFELYTAGVGVAGVVGAGCTVLGCYGLAVLPARGWAVALLVATVLCYAVDVQTGVPRVWTAVGTFALVVGSLRLYDGLELSWITLLVGIAGMLLFVIGAMPAMVRTRFSTPTIGRGWMIGEEGEAVSAVDPEGVVSVRGAPWRARTNRATPVPAGEAVRVVEVDGLLLEVEPLEGAATDHRERHRKD